MRVDPDDPLQEFLLGLEMGTAEGTPDSGRVHVPLWSHSRSETRTNRSSFGSQPAHADGRHFVSDPARDSRRYGTTATPALMLNQALRGYWRAPIGTPACTQVQYSGDALVAGRHTRKTELLVEIHGVSAAKHNCDDGRRLSR